MAKYLSSKILMFNYIGSNALPVGTAVTIEELRKYYNYIKESLGENHEIYSAVGSIGVQQVIHSYPMYFGLTKKSDENGNVISAVEKKEYIPEALVRDINFAYDIPFSMENLTNSYFGLKNEKLEAYKDNPMRDIRSMLAKYSEPRDSQEIFLSILNSAREQYLGEDVGYFSRDNFIESGREILTLRFPKTKIEPFSGSYEADTYTYGGIPNFYHNLSVATQNPMYLVNTRNKKICTVLPSASVCFINEDYSAYKLSIRFENDSIKPFATSILIEFFSSEDIKDYIAEVMKLNGAKSMDILERIKSGYLLPADITASSVKRNSENPIIEIEDIFDIDVLDELRKKKDSEKESIGSRLKSIFGKKEK